MVDVPVLHHTYTFELFPSNISDDRIKMASLTVSSRPDKTGSIAEYFPKLNLSYGASLLLARCEDGQHGISRFALFYLSFPVTCLCSLHRVCHLVLASENS